MFMTFLRGFGSFRHFPVLFTKGWIDGSRMSGQTDDLTLRNDKSPKYEIM